MASEPQVTRIEDLALLNEENAIRIEVNGTEKFVSKDWLEDGGRAAGSALAKQILGTEEGLQGTTRIIMDESFASEFDLLIVWLAIGDSHLKTSLTEENASNLFALASYYNLDQLEASIQEEQKRRDEEERLKEERQRRELQAAVRRVCRKQQHEERERRYRARGMVKCVACGDFTSVAPTYNGNRPRCRDCRDDFGRYGEDVYDGDAYDEYLECDVYDDYADCWDYSD